MENNTKQDVDRMLAALDTHTQLPDEPPLEKVIDVHIYEQEHAPQEQVSDETTYETTVEPDAETILNDEAQEQERQTIYASMRTPHRLPMWAIICIVASVVGLVTGIGVYLWPALTPIVTVTIVPVYQTVSMSTSITVNTGKAT